MSYTVYILYSQSLDIYYKGQTNDLADRLKRHNNKQEIATKKGAPWVVAWFTYKQSRTEAVVLERKLKNLSRKRLVEFINKYQKLESPDDPDR